MFKPYYHRGPVQIFHGDNQEWLSSLGPGSIDAVVTDPPYNCGYGYDLHHDTMAEDLYLSWLSGLFVEASRAGASSIVWFWQGSRVANGEARACLPDGWRIHHLASWFKQEFAGDLWKGGHPAYAWEPIIWATNAAEVKYEGPKGGHAGRDCLIGNSSRHDRLAKGHPCPKPEKVVCGVVRWVPGKVIADPFTGSGTTAIGAIRAGRMFVGCELSEAYCEIAARRCEIELEQQKFFVEPDPPPVQRTLAG